LSADHLFVYGTLRRGSNNQFARLLAERAHFVGPARVSGRLYDFGSYPGARREEGSIIGEIVRLDPLGELLGVLESVENCPGCGGKPLAIGESCPVCGREGSIA